MDQSAQPSKPPPPGTGGGAGRIGGSRPRYLLVKAHVGFGDRLQALSHAVHYALQFGRVLCVDWTDDVWSDGTIDFDTFFDLCGVPRIAPADLYRLRVDGVAPPGWTNQVERRADSAFLYKQPYANVLPEADHPAQLIVYGGVGLRKYHADNLGLLRVKKPWRDRIIAELRKYAGYATVVHLRGTDRVPAAEYDAYLYKLPLADIPAGEPPLVVSDCLPLVERFRLRRPDAVLRTPHLEQFNAATGTHFQASVPKAEANLQLLTDFFLIAYADKCVSDGVSVFSLTARFLRGPHLADILGYDREVPPKG